MLKPLDSAQFIWAAESRHSGSVPDNRDFRPAKRRLIDTLSKRRNGISSSYPDLLDPSFGSCLRGGNPRKKAKIMVAGPCTILNLNQVQKVIVNCLFTLRLSNLTQSLPDSAIPSKRHFVVPLSLETVPNGTFFNRSSDICF